MSNYNFFWYWSLMVLSDYYWLWDHSELSLGSAWETKCGARYSNWGCWHARQATYILYSLVWILFFNISKKLKAKNLRIIALNHSSKYLLVLFKTWTNWFIDCENIFIVIFLLDKWSEARDTEQKISRGLNVQRCTR